MSKINKELKDYEREILLEKYKTALKKNQFLNELKNGMGEEMKKNPSKVKILKKSWREKLNIFFLKLFTKF